MFRYVRSILSGMPPVAPPLDNVPYTAAVAVAEGDLLTLPGHTVAGKVSLATKVEDVFGVAMNDAAANASVRMAYVVPGMIFKTTADEATSAGAEVGINATSDGVRVNGTGLRVLKYELSGTTHWVWVTFMESALSQNRAADAMITEFKFDKTINSLSADIVGVIDQAARTIKLAAPAGTTVSALKATFTTTEFATVKVGDTVQTSGTTPNDFTDDVVYVVTSSDGRKVVSYTVTVTVAEA